MISTKKSIKLLQKINDSFHCTHLYMSSVNRYFNELATESVDKEKKHLMICDFRLFAFKKLNEINEEIHSYLKYPKFQNERDVDLKDVKEINLLISDIYHAVLLSNESLTQMKKNFKKYFPEEQEKCREIQYLRDHIVFMIARYADYWSREIEGTIIYIKDNQEEFLPDLVQRFELLQGATRLMYDAVIDRLLMKKILY